MANMDQSFLIELDANISPTILNKQLIQRLQSYVIRKAARPMRINEPFVINSEEEEGATDQGSSFIDPTEMEEILNGLQYKRRLNSKYKWHRSKFSYYCPVSLKNGKIISGKPDYAATFLNKVYLMANESALKDFLKNPRPFISPPQPRAPCKLSIIGPARSGKTTLSKLLARKYNATVVDMQKLAEPSLKKAKEELIERKKEEAIEQCKNDLINRYRDYMDKKRSNFISK
jgi:adenylate/nucleoside-diphosphate kinase